MRTPAFLHVFAVNCYLDFRHGSMEADKDLVDDLYPDNTTVNFICENGFFPNTMRHQLIVIKQTGFPLLHRAFRVREFVLKNIDQ